MKLLKITLGALILSCGMYVQAQTPTEETPQVLVLEFNQAPGYAGLQPYRDAGIDYIGQISKTRHCVSYPNGSSTGALMTLGLKSCKTYKELADFSIDEMHFTNETERKQLTVSYFDSRFEDDLLAILSSMNLQPVPETTQGTSMDVLLNKNEALALFDVSIVQTITDIPEVLDYEDAREVRSASSRMNYLNNISNGLNYAGQGRTVGIIENVDLDPSEIDFQNRVQGPQVGPTVVKTHSKYVARNLLGGGNLDPLDAGVVPKATVWCFDKSAFLFAFAQAADNNNVFVVNESKGSGVEHNYIVDSRQLDNFLVNRDTFMYVKSAGNYRNKNAKSYLSGIYGNGINQYAKLGDPKSECKNSITVGSFSRKDEPISSSSPGPAIDGRIKPDLVANASSTSGAAPRVAGALTQLSEFYVDQHPMDREPSKAMLKAILLNTADDVGNPGPDYRFGFGKMNVRRAYEVLRNQQVSQGQVAHGASTPFQLAIPSGAIGVKVLLYWHDQGPTLTTVGNKRILDVDNGDVALVNDLDLTIDNPVTGSPFLPLVLNPRATINALGSDAREKVDTLNNVEQIVLSNLALAPPGSSLDIQVTGSNITASQNQKFFLTYEFLFEEALITYPMGGEKLKTREEHFIRFDGQGNTNPYVVFGSIDRGSTWIPIDTAKSVSARFVTWNTRKWLAEMGQNVNDGYEVILRIQELNSNVILHTTEVFVVAPVPQNFVFKGMCDVQGSLTSGIFPQPVVNPGNPISTGTNPQPGLYTIVDWDVNPRADLYNVYTLRNRFMQVKDTYGDDFAGLRNETSEWYSVSCVFEKTDAQGNTYLIEGPRSIAVQRDGTLIWCP